MVFFNHVKCQCQKKKNALQQASVEDNENYEAIIDAVNSVSRYGMHILI